MGNLKKKKEKKRKSTMEELTIKKEKFVEINQKHRRRCT